MVFFTCSHCGESVKKPSVAKHYQTKCRNLTPFVTCVDCLKDFKGNEYEAHTKCFTEEERYAAKGFVPKASANKGERKQKAWSDCVQGLLSSGSLQQDEKSLLESICKHENIPRKKVKFINFLNSTARSFANRTELIDRVWEKLDNYFKEINSASQNNAESNGATEKEEGAGKSENQNKKKRKQDEMTEGDEKNPEGEKTKKKKKKKQHSAEPVNGEEIVNKEQKKKKRPSDDEKEGVNGEDEPKSKKSKKNVAENGLKEKENKKKNAKDEKSTENDDAEEDENGTTEDETFDWTDAIVKILSESGSKNKIKLGKLQKKVLKKYGEANGCEIDEKIIKKFSKKLKKIDSVNVNGDYVSLKS